MQSFGGYEIQKIEKDEIHWDANNLSNPDFNTYALKLNETGFSPIYSVKYLEEKGTKIVQQGDTYISYNTVQNIAKKLLERFPDQCDNHTLGVLIQEKAAEYQNAFNKVDEQTKNQLQNGLVKLHQKPQQISEESKKSNALDEEEKGNLLFIGEAEEKGLHKRQNTQPLNATSVSNAQQESTTQASSLNLLDVSNNASSLSRMDSTNQMQRQKGFWESLFCCFNLTQKRNQISQNTI